MKQPLALALLGLVACLLVFVRPTPGGAAPPAPAAEPPPLPGGPPVGTKLEWFLVRPGRVVNRDVWEVGQIEGRPWDANTRGGPGWIRVRAIIAHEDGLPEQKVKGVEVVLINTRDDRAFLFDAEQMPDLLGAVRSLNVAAEKLREPQVGAARHATTVINGLEIGMNPRRSGGYVAAFGPEEASIGLSPDNFVQLTALLEKAQTTLTERGG